MLRTMGIDLRDGERSRPSQDQGKEKQNGKKNNKVGGAGDTRFQPPIDVDFLHPLAFRFKSRLIPNRILVAFHLITSYPASSLWLQELAGPSVRPPKPSESPPQSAPSAPASSLPTPPPPSPAPAPRSPNSAPPRAHFHPTRARQLRSLDAPPAPAQTEFSPAPAHSEFSAATLSNPPPAARASFPNAQSRPSPATRSAVRPP